MPEPKRCSCCEKHTLRAQEEKKKLLNRLRQHVVAAGDGRG